ncbi:TIGR01777 family oxidoreductase [Marisediminitalea aggregata]|uniref:TIGR01777 family oxidoreductase n=1 Tax=Marisediminitalea aggregata TaxID=634436 RepID=UPI0020CB96A4|nr:TIGR01777 family oxidoreductase [Marisediminitalea aggregata]MCP9478454.1 TIGR01777 family oxidoreductase [Marisediminitalea aggregata]
MHIFITGGTGLIGRHLIPALLRDPSTKITVLTRDAIKAKASLPDNVALVTSLDDTLDFDNVDAVINLAGEPIADKRWSETQKTRICESRWQITQQLTDKINAAEQPPATFISGSAIGYYGRQGDKLVTEAFTEVHHEFTHTVCEQWERIALQASQKTRVCLLRTGVVLSGDGGALSKMRLPFSLGLGGRIGDGNQYMSWIHINDMVAAILFLLKHKNCEGAYNLTAPTPVTNTEFVKAYAASLGRPAIFPMPALALKLLMGEAADLLLTGQRVVPQKLQDARFQFTFSDVQSAFADIESDTHRSGL